MLVYDVTSQESFKNARSWQKEIENNADEDILVYLVGNQADLEDEQPAQHGNAKKLHVFQFAGPLAQGVLDPGQLVR